jgi:hypothetical protein
VNFETKVVGSQPVHETMHERYVLNDGNPIDYALGLVHSTHRGIKIVEHSGGDAGYRTWCGRAPDHRLGVVILSNLATFVPQAMAREVMQIFLAEHLEPESAEQPQDAAAHEAECIDGRYLIGYIGSVRVRTREDGVYFSLHNGGEVFGERQRDGAYRLRLLGRDVKIRFSAECAVVETAGMKIQAKRVHDVTISEDAAGEYVGEYFSDELGTSYEVKASGNSLVLAHRRHDDAELLPGGGDLFYADTRGYPELRFVRSDSGVTGFAVNANRIRNVQFWRK